MKMRYLPVLALGTVPACWSGTETSSEEMPPSAESAIADLYIVPADVSALVDTPVTLGPGGGPGTPDCKQTDLANPDTCGGTCDPGRTCAFADGSCGCKLDICEELEISQVIDGELVKTTVCKFKTEGVGCPVDPECTLIGDICKCLSSEGELPG